MKELTNNLQNQAYQLILEKILGNEYVPKQKISQQTLESELQLGRTPIREALLRLQREGLVTVVPQSGTFVTKINLESAFNARFIREHLEREIFAEVAQNPPNPLLLAQAEEAIHLQEQAVTNKEMSKFFEADEIFHKSFYVAVNRLQVWKWIQTVNIQLQRFRSLRLTLSDLPWETLIEQHKGILEAVRNQDVQQTDLLVEEHLHLVFQEEKKIIAAYPDYFESLPKQMSLEENS